jgi:hypothetical protein
MYGEVLVKGNAHKVSGAVNAEVSDQRAKNEVLASKLMQAALGNHAAPEMNVVDLEGKYGGGLGVTSKWMQGENFDPNNANHVAAAQDAFAVHAWLANYDVLGMGYDNIKITPAGYAANIDPGGALLFRAQGLPKYGLHKGLLDPTAPELLTMLDTTSEQSKVFGNMTVSSLQASAKSLNAVSDDTIKKLCKTYGPGNDAFNAQLADNLIARKNAILVKTNAVEPQSVTDTLTPKANDQPPALAQGVNASLPGQKAQAQTASPTKLSDIKDKDKPKAIQTLSESHLADLIKGDIALDPLVNSSNEYSLQKAPSFPYRSVPHDAISAMNKLHAQGDLSGLLIIAAIHLKSAYNPNYGVNAAQTYHLLSDHAKDLAAQLMWKNKQVAEAITPPSPVIKKPTIITGMNSADVYYKNYLDNFEAHHAKGDLEGLKAAAITPEKVFGVPWNPNTQAGKSVAAYHASLVADLENKKAAVTITEVKAQDAAISQPANVPVQQNQNAAGNFAMPNPETYKFELKSTHSGVTAKDIAAHNATIDKLQSMAVNGDIKGMLSLKYGVNTYGKKKVAFVNNVMAAFKLPHTVTIGQAANSHPAITAGYTPTQVAAAAAATHIAAPQASNATATVAAAVKASAPTETKAAVYRVPGKPDFANWQGNGKGLSSKAVVNKQNDDLAEQIYNLASKGDIAGLKAMKFTPIDPNTGAPNGLPTPILSHPSKHITAYYADALKGATTPYVPPQVVSIGDFGHIHELFQKCDKEFETPPNAKLNETGTQAGRYSILGIVEANVKDALEKWTTQELSQGNKALDRKSLYDQSQANYSKLSSIEKQAIREYTESGYKSINDPVTGEGTHSKAGYAIAGLNRASVPLPTGTVLSRRFGFAQKSDFERFKKAIGGVVKDFGVISTSTNSTAWHAIDPHKVQLRITVGDGVKGLYVDRDPSGSSYNSTAISGNPGEGEIMLPYGTRFYIKKVHPPSTPFKDQHGIWGQDSNETVIEVIALPNIN